VKKYMLRYGIDNVIGGSYSQVNLAIAQGDMLQCEMDSADNNCCHCYGSGHFMNGFHVRYSCGNIDSMSERNLIRLLHPIHVEVDSMWVQS